MGGTISADRELSAEIPQRVNGGFCLQDWWHLRGRGFCDGGTCLGSWLGVRATHGGNRRVGWCAWKIRRNLARSSKGGERMHRRPADGFDGSERGQRHSCGNGRRGELSCIATPEGRGSAPNRRHLCVAGGKGYSRGQ